MFCYSILQSEQPEDIFSSTNCGSESDGVFSSVVSFSSSSSSSVKSGSSVGIWMEYFGGRLFHLILFIFFCICCLLFVFDPTMLFRKSLLGRFPGAFTRPDMKIKKRVIMCWYDDNERMGCLYQRWDSEEQVPPKGKARLWARFHPQSFAVEGLSRRRYLCWLLLNGGGGKGGWYIRSIMMIPGQKQKQLFHLLDPPYPAFPGPCSLLLLQEG